MQSERLITEQTSTWPKPDFWTVWKQNGWVHHEHRLSSHGTRWRVENIWLPFGANGNLWLCHTWRAVSASALFFNARQWGALMDCGQSPQSLQGSLLTFITWFIYFLLYSEGAETKRCVFLSLFAPLMKRMTATQYLCQKGLLPRLPANNYHRNYPSRRRRPDEVFLAVLALGLTWVMDSWHFKAQQLLSLFRSCRRNRQKQWSCLIRPNDEDICLSNSPAISSPLCTPRPSAEQNGSYKGKQLTPYAGKERKKKNSHLITCILHHLDISSAHQRWHPFS